MPDLVAPSAVSDFLLVESRERGDLLTNLKLQKLLYYSQAWHLALQNQPLFNEDFQAWIHGPVLPSQYHRFKDAEWRALTLDVQAPTLTMSVKDHLLEIVDVFGSESAVALELMTHQEQPWIEARKGLPADAPSSAVISKATMRDYYRSLSGEDKKN